jgi:hypothetical protein
MFIKFCIVHLISVLVNIQIKTIQNIICKLIKYLSID